MKRTYTGWAQTNCHSSILRVLCSNATNSQIYTVWVRKTFIIVTCAWAACSFCKCDRCSERSDLWALCNFNALLRWKPKTHKHCRNHAISAGAKATTPCSGSRASQCVGRRLLKTALRTIRTISPVITRTGWNQLSLSTGGGKRCK